MSRLPSPDDPPALVEPGEYELRFLGLRTSNVFNTAKVAFWFSIVTPGEAFEEALPRWYRVRSVSSSKRFRFSWRGELVREYYQLFPARADKLRKATEFPVTKLRDHVIVGRVETVISDHKQRPLAENMRYSVVRELLRLAD